MAKFLIVVDVQKDFTIGSLAIPDAKSAIPFINENIINYERNRDQVIYTMDFHEPRHCSFKEQGGPWPPHCIEGTDGQAFDADVFIVTDPILVPKAYHKEEYSAKLWPWIRPYDDVELVGFATDYCVFETVKYLNEYCTPRTMSINLNGCRGIWNKNNPAKFIKNMAAYCKITGAISKEEVNRYAQLQVLTPF